MTALLTDQFAITPRRALLGPNWFASVMGTGIVANAAVTLPVHHIGLELFARVVWIAAAILLLFLLLITAAQWFSRTAEARGHLADPVLSHFYGAPAMALMTVGTGALLVGQEIIGTAAATTMSLILWLAGTTLGVWTTFAVPRRMRHTYRGTAFGGWLMPVVPPMVSAAAGAVLAPYLAPALRTPMAIICWALFTLAMVASIPLIAVIAARVTRGQLGAALTIPTLFIVVGPLGQSATAAHGLAEHSTFAVVYASIVLTLAAAWLAVACTVLVRTARAGLPFAMTWWSFTFPIGTVVTGTAGLAAATGLLVLDVAAVALFAVLISAWTVVAIRTLSGVRSGALLPLVQTA